MLFFISFFSFLTLCNGKHSGSENNFEEVYVCDEMDSESRTLLISPQGNYVYDRLLDYPAGRLLPTGGSKEIDRLLTVSGLLKGKSDSNLCMTIIETFQAFSSLEVIGLTDSIRTRCFSSILIVIDPTAADLNRGQVLKEQEQEILFSQLDLLGLVYEQEMWKNVAFLFILENDLHDDNLLISGPIQNLMSSLQVWKSLDIVLPHFFLEKNTMSRELIDFQESRKMIDPEGNEECRCFKQRSPNFFLSEESSLNKKQKANSIPWMSPPLHATIGYLSNRTSFTCYISSPKLNPNDVTIISGNENLDPESYRMVIEEKPNDMNAVRITITSPSESEYFCVHNGLSSENSFNVTFADAPDAQFELLSSWSAWSKCENANETTSRFRLREFNNGHQVIIEQETEERGCLCQDLRELPHPRILLLGATGVGKSTFGNQILGGKKRFAAGHSLESKTEHISVSSGNFLGTGKCMTIIDTPGARDTFGRDYQQSLEMQKLLKNEIGSFDAILLFWKGTETRFDKGTLELLQWYEAIFGNEMWDFVIIETTFWSHRQHDADKRNKQRKLTEEKLKTLIMKELKSLNITAQDYDLKIVFIDPTLPIFTDTFNPTYFEPEQREKEKFREETAKLEDIIAGFQSSFNCKERCQAPDEFFSGAPWLVQPYTGIVNVKAGVDFIVEWQIWRQAIEDDSFDITLNGEIIFQRVQGKTIYLESEDLTFTVEENTILKKITSIKFQSKLSKNFGQGSYNGTLKLENTKGRSSVTQIYLVVDAWFGKWSKWSQCSISCIDEIQPVLGVKTRMRECHSEINGGKICQEIILELDPEAVLDQDANQVQTISCSGSAEYQIYCPVEPQWRLWSEWSECSFTCGSSSSRSRERFCKDGSHGGNLCSTPIGKQVLSCSVPPCIVECEWESWSPCSKHCGLGVKKRKRIGIKNCAEPLVQEEQCSNRPCDSSQNCKTNNYDGDQYCRCEEGVAVKSIVSVHMNWYEDRAWTLHCRDEVNYGAKQRSETHFNGYDARISVEFKKGNEYGYLSGMQSFHSNHEEDRKFQFFYSFPNNYKIGGNCQRITANGYDQLINFILSSDEVITGIDSSHSNHHEDRIWIFTVCKISKI